jgi:DNA-binding transcriptional MocR family regulator
MSPQHTDANTAALDLNRSAVARYIQLASLFRRRIDAGQWPPKQQIPTVDELAAECGVARATIRRALDMLGKRGLDRAVSRQGHLRPRAPAAAAVVRGCDGLVGTTGSAGRRGDRTHLSRLHRRGTLCGDTIRIDMKLK